MVVPDAVTSQVGAPDAFTFNDGAQCGLYVCKPVEPVVVVPVSVTSIAGAPGDACVHTGAVSAQAASGGCSADKATHLADVVKHKQKLKGRRGPSQSFRLTQEDLDGLGPHVPPEITEALQTMVLIGVEAEAQALFAKIRQRRC